MKYLKILRSNICFSVYLIGIVVAFMATSKNEQHSFVKVLDLVDPGRAAIDISIEITRFSIALNTGVVAAASALATKGADWIVDWGLDSSLLLVFAFFGCALSYYGTYSSLSILLEMTQISGVDPASGALAEALAIEYYSALLSAILLGMVFVRFLDRRPRNNRVKKI